MNMRYIACVWSCISAPSVLRAQPLRTSIPLRYISVAGLRFGSVRAACSASPHLDSASLHLGRGQSAYVIHNAPPNSCEHDCAHRYVCRTFIFAVLRTSIPLRYISVAGLRFGSVRAACSASPHLDSASLHLGRGQSAYVIHNAPPNSCEHDCAHRYVCRTQPLSTRKKSIN